MVTHAGQEDPGNDHLLKMLFIVKEIILVGTIEIYGEQFEEHAC